MVTSSRKENVMATTFLRERMRQMLRVRNYSKRTEETYLDAVGRFARHFRRRPDQMGAEEVRAYQLWLRDERHASSCVINQVAGALRFFFTYVVERPETVDHLCYAKREHRLPVVLSAEELLRFLNAVNERRYRAMLTTMYAAGLRLSETLHLRVDDIDSARMLIRVKEGKGKKGSVRASLADRAGTAA